MPEDFQEKLFAQILEPVTRCLSPKAAGSLARLRAAPIAQARMDELAGKCSEGRLTADEKTEYTAYVSAANLLAILQSKARRLLDRGL